MGSFLTNANVGTFIYLGVFFLFILFFCIGKSDDKVMGDDTFIDKDHRNEA